MGDFSYQYVSDWSAASADSFPHVYGPINLDDVIEIVPV